MRYELAPVPIGDPATRLLVGDALSVWSRIYQGMVPVGDWLQIRVAHLIREWVGTDWCISHGQLFDPADISLQTRSWDLIVHRRPPPTFDIPPPATPDGPWTLLPMDLCAAVVDTKGRYNTPKTYAAKTLFNDRNDCPDRQITLLKAHGVRPSLFVLASTYDPWTVMDAGRHCGLPTFVLCHAEETLNAGRERHVEWTLACRDPNPPPLGAFREYMQKAVSEWHSRNR